MIVDPVKAAAFVANYPKAANVNAGNAWMASGDPNGPFAAYNGAYNFVNPSGNAGGLDVEGDERGHAYVLDKMDTGIALLKADATGTYKEIHTVKTTDAAGNPAYSKYNCN